MVANPCTELQMPSACSQCGAFVFSTGDHSELDLTTATRARIADLSSTNEPPLNTELSAIRSILEQTSAGLADLDAEISRLKDHLRDLEEKRTALSRCHSQNTQILSPLRRMPPEILGEIFSWTVPSIRDVFNTKDCPWVLTHVCSTWRAVALYQPSLWSLIVVDFSIEERCPLKLISTQIERARLLKIRFFGHENYDSHPQIALFNLLAEHSPRWEEFEVQLTSDLVPHVRTLDFTPLRRAWVQWDTAQSQTPEYDTVDFFQTSTSLIDVGVYCEYRFLPTRLPVLHHLTRYDFDAPWETHSQLLKSFPNLQEVRIQHDFDENEDWPESGEPIDLLHLRWLFVNDVTALNYLRAPSLQEIAIHLSDTEDAKEICHSLERFLERSSCLPYGLRIEGLVDTSIAAILKKCPSFTEIAVISDNEEDEDEYTKREILSLFTVVESDPTKTDFPHITEIGYAFRQNPGALLPPFLTMLESRWNFGDCALKSAKFVALHSDVHWDPESMAGIQALQNAGLRVSLLSGDDADNCFDQWLFRV
ncbi:F-box domain-containing protein [Mycena sanguinolenta]|uniref:F-box domain-containing protein n=1 Tax=Mycena sanguinolenta TaxID=230812 RepID=A0A8H7CZ05_9AGAR|nr:F-box domain-containing protein [Mycena sanguinolenta]